MIIESHTVAIREKVVHLENTVERRIFKFSDESLGNNLFLHQNLQFYVTASVIQLSLKISD